MPESLLNILHHSPVAARVIMNEGTDFRTFRKAKLAEMAADKSTGSGYKDLRARQALHIIPQ